jgi:hypothetical protein
MLHRNTPPSAALLLLLALACDEGGERACAAHAECASGLCRPDGTCAPDHEDGGPGDGAPAADAGVDGPAAPCAPDHDGSITRAEFPLGPGLGATFRIATDADVDLVGTPIAGGGRRWDLSGTLAGDRDAEVATLPVDGAWWAPAFPAATHAARLADGEELLGVFRATDAALLLLGVVSPEGGFARTELAYDPPVTVLSFPLAPGKTWSTDAGVSGLALGWAAAYRELYESEVDAAGELVTPFGAFPVLRVRVRLARTVGIQTTTVRTFAFAAECFGGVATVVSGENEPAVEFTRAAEARRLAP